MFLNRDWGTNKYVAFTKSQINNLGDNPFLLIREPNSCFPVDTIWLDHGTGFPTIQRPVYLPEIPGATTDKTPGEHHVASMGTFQFIIYPDASQGGKIPEISTSRKLMHDGEGLIVTPNPDGSYTVQILKIQESVEIYVKFTTSNATLNRSAIWANSNLLYIRSEKDCTANVYTLSGEVLKSIAVTAGEVSATSLPQGMYVVKIDDENHKVVIK